MNLVYDFIGLLLLLMVVVVAAGAFVGDEPAMQASTHGEEPPPISPHEIKGGSSR